MQFLCSTWNRDVRNGKPSSLRPAHTRHDGDCKEISEEIYWQRSALLARLHTRSGNEGWHQGKLQEEGAHDLFRALRR